MWSREHFRDVAPKTVAGYENAFKHCEKLRNMKLRNLRTADYQEVVDERLYLSRSSLCLIKSLLSQLCIWAMREDITDRNYAQFIKLPKSDKKKR